MKSFGGLRPAFLALAWLCFTVATHGQGNSGAIEGVVKDPSGAAVANARVEIAYVVSGFHREATTGTDGSFKFTNVPFNTYHTVVTAAGFASFAQDIDVRSTVPVNVEIDLN